MISTAVVRIVDLCARNRWQVIVAGTLVMVGAAVFAATHFSINTDIESLIADLPWHERQIEMTRAFPQKAISAVVKAPTTENAELATNELSQALAKNTALFPIVTQPESGDFFERNGVLFASPDEVKQTAGGLAGAQPMLAQLAGDPSLRGVMKALTAGAEGARAGKLKLEQLKWPLTLAQNTLGDVLAGKPTS